MKKFNIIYILWLGVFWICFKLFEQITIQNQYTFFGSAEVEGHVVNCEYAVLIQKVLIKTGQMVHRGDTLAILSRSDLRDLQRRSLEKWNEIEQFKTEKQARIAEISQEIVLSESKKAVMLRDLETQIQLLQAEIGVQADLKKILANPNNEQASSVRTERIKALQGSIESVDKQMAQQKALLEAQIKANQAIFDSKISLSEKERQLIDFDQKHFVLLAPSDGFVENVSMTPNEIIPSRQTIAKITPVIPNRVRGFLNETGTLKSNVGDTIYLRSVARTGVTAQGIFLTGNPQVVELPMRLRKYPEIKSWGREIFIQLPDTHRFFIGEKIILQSKLNR